MARTWNGAAANYLRSLSVPSIIYPTFISTWFRWNVIQSFGMTVAGIGELGSGSNVWQTVLNTNPGNTKIRIEESARFVNANPQSENVFFAAGEWHHLLSAFRSATDRENYYDGVSVAVDSVTDTVGPPINLSSYQLGINSSTSNPFDGELCELAVGQYSVDALDTAALAAELAGGASPLIASQEGGTLLSYLPVFGRYDPEPDIVGGFNMDLFGALLRADHVPGIYLDVERTISIPSAAAGGFVDLSGELRGVGTLTGTLTLEQLVELAGALEGVGDMAGTLVKFEDRDFAGALEGVGTITGTLDPQFDPAGALEGVGTLDGTLTLEPVVDLAGALEGVGDIDGTLVIGGVVDFAGLAQGVGDIVGELVKFEDRDFAGALDGVGTLDGTLDLVPVVELAGALEGVGDVAGTLSLQGFIEFAGALEGVGDVSGTVDLANVDFAGAMEGVGDILGTLVKGTAIEFAGALEGVGVLSGTLDKAGVVDLEGLAQGVGDIVGFAVKTTPTLLRATEPSIVSVTPIQSAQSVTPKRTLDPLI